MRGSWKDRPKYLESIRSELQDQGVGVATDDPFSTKVEIVTTIQARES
jgi:hypothetical protein